MNHFYYILTQDGTETCITEADFRKILKEDNARAKRGEPRLYFHYEDVDSPNVCFHTLMPRTQQHEAAYRVNKRPVDAAAKQHERDTRCRIVVNGKTKICTAVCSKCAKNGERTSHASLSLDETVGTKSEPTDDSNDIAKIIEDKLLLEALIDSLSEEEFALIDAVYYQGDSLLGYAKELCEQADTSVDVMRSRLRRLHDNAMKKLRTVLKDWQ